MTWEYMFYREPNPFQHKLDGQLTRKLLLEDLNRLGSEGWEVIRYKDSEYMLKRLIKT